MCVNNTLSLSSLRIQQAVISNLAAHDVPANANLNVSPKFLFLGLHKQIFWMDRYALPPSELSFAMFLQMYRTVKNTERPAASSGEQRFLALE